MTDQSIEVMHTCKYCTRHFPIRIRYHEQEQVDLVTELTAKTPLRDRQQYACKACTRMIEDGDGVILARIPNGSMRILEPNTKRGRMGILSLTASDAYDLWDGECIRCPMPVFKLFAKPEAYSVVIASADKRVMIEADGFDVLLGYIRVALKGSDIPDMFYQEARDAE